MNARPATDPSLADPRDLSPIPDELRLFARIEGLVGEEAALLAVPHHKRSDQQRQRLRVIGEELDRVWEALRDRAEHLHGKARTSPRGS